MSIRRGGGRQTSRGDHKGRKGAKRAKREKGAKGPKGRIRRRSGLLPAPAWESDWAAGGAAYGAPYGNEHAGLVQSDLAVDLPDEDLGEDLSETLDMYVLGSKPRCEEVEYLALMEDAIDRIARGS